MLSEVLDDIEQQTSYLFIFNNEVNVGRKVSVKVKNESVSGVLDKLLVGTDVKYALNGMHIVLSKKELPPSVSPVGANVNQQTGKRITGVVMDTMNEPIIGANIIERGTANGTVTDINGDFSLTVSSNAVLQVSYIGYITQEINVLSAGGGESMIIRLIEDSQALEEVVVVGYGTVRKSDLTGAVSSIDNSIVSRQASANTSQALRGQIAGLSVQQTSGKAGAVSNVILRGQSAIGKTVQPLVIIDGMPSDWTTFNALNPEDIERLDVLKDASSTAIYGSRASGGVIIVTTRSGREGKNMVTYNGYAGMKVLTHMPEMMGSEKFNQLRLDAISLGFTTKETILGNDEEEYLSKGISTNWVDLVTRDAFQTSHNISVGGGNKNETHLISVGYYKADGSVISDSYERYSLNLKAAGNVLDKFTLAANVYASFSEEQGADGSVLSGAYSMKPWGNPKNDDGTDRDFPILNESGMYHPVINYKNSYNEHKRFIVNGSIFVEYKPVEGLILKSNFMPAYYGDRYGAYVGEETWANAGVPGTSNSNVRNTWQFAYTWENTVAYHKKFNKDHFIGVTGLFSLESGRRESYYAAVRDLTYDNEFWYNLAASTAITGLTGEMNNTLLESYMLRANYGYRDKYLLTLTGRWDGSSKLAPGKQWGFFPSVALAWRAGEEAFVKDLNIFSNLKFRLSYGVAGNNAVDPYASWAKLSTTIYDWDGSPAKGAAAAMANKALTWEKSHEYNLGIDLGFFDERLSASVDLYSKTTKDIILSRQVPVHQGVTSLDANIGSVLNRGIELTLNSVNIRMPDFTWTTSLNFSTNHNEILDLYGDKKDDVGNKRFIGAPVEVNHNYKFIGIWQSEEAELAQKYTEKPGMVKRLDVGGDGRFTPDDDYMILGSPFPTWTGGITNNFAYRNWDFSFFIYTRQGEQVLSGFHQSYATSFQCRYNLLNVDYWMPDRQSDRWWAPGFNGSAVTNYKDVSFWRVGNITLGRKIKAPGFSNLRVYATVNNPFLFTKYEGWDPEWASAGTSALPLNGATYMAGINLSF
ncbi:MAG: TonB-dependent receptor [Tannerella sp.]|nr:TonB-dependent receptor [Tannerella sp.]